jgi:hypothetical protein
VQNRCNLQHVRFPTLVLLPTVSVSCSQLESRVQAQREEVSERDADDVDTAEEFGIGPRESIANKEED